MLTFKRAGAALALVILLLPAGVEAGGWYLMAAPSRLDLDSSCRDGGWPTWRDVRDALHTDGTISEARMYRCFREYLTAEPTAPLSQWLQLTAPSGSGSYNAPQEQSAFSELSACEMARNADAGQPPTHPEYSEFSDWFGNLFNDPELAKMDAKAPDKSATRSKSLSELDRAEADEAKAELRTLEDFERTHPENYHVRAAILLLGKSALSKDASNDNYERCVASDDPRLKEK
jgi:hypothetical protein